VYDHNSILNMLDNLKIVFPELVV